MKAVQLLANSFFPEELRDYKGNFTKKDIERRLQAVGHSDAFKDKFAEIEKKLSDLGRKASYYQGETITLDDLRPIVDKKTMFANMDAEIKALPKDKNYAQKKAEIQQKYNTWLEKEVGDKALANRNNLALAVLSGARGKSAQLKAMLGSPMQFSDSKGRTIDVISKESYAEGVRPSVYLASTYGSRSSVVSTKCIDGETLVRMADLSERKLKDIKVGEFVLGADKEGHTFPVEVLNVFDQGDKDCYTYRFKFSNGELEQTEVTCTEDHKFLMVSAREYNRKRSLYLRGNGPAPRPEEQHNLEMVKAGRMSRGARCSAYNPMYPRGGYTGSKHEPWARIIGLLIGDGCLTIGCNTVLSCADNILIGDITQELDVLGHSIRKVGGDNYSWVISQANYNAGDNRSIVPGVKGFVKGRLNPRNQMLEDYGLLGHYAWEKRFPIGWQTWDKESMAALIAGVFAADGSVYSTKNSSGRTQVSITIAVTSAGLIKDLKLALSIYFGITGREERPVLVGGFGSSTELREHPLYTLEISRAEDVLRFREVFGYKVPGIKKYTLDKECAKIVIKQRNPYAKHMFQKKEHVGMVHCYDIEVDHPDHLFVLANGLITSNSSTAKGGDISKQFAQVAGDIIVKKNNCGTSNGIPLEIDDKSLKGRALAKDAGPFKAGTFLTKDDIATLRKRGVKNVVVRSALTCGVDGGVCAHCLGKFYKGGRLPEVGDAVGLTASSVVGEPITQLALNMKHTSGMTSAKRTYGGLPTIIQFTQSPEKYKDRAAVSEVDGKVEKVEEAPQGGMYVTVEGHKHYVPSGHEVEVKPGDEVEAGDFLSEGLGDAEDIVRLKGLGAGRKYYADRLNRILKDSGTWTDPRNTEILARAAVRHVRVTSDEGLGNYLPDDIVDYSAIQNSYKMPETTTVADPRRVVGKYLQAPAMHYTIGTRITNKVAKDLYDNGYTGVYADSYQPSFEPEMVRLRASSHTNRDWVASLGTSYITKQLNEAVERGDDTNVEENTDYRPRIAWGKGFGEHVRETGKF